MTETMLDLCITLVPPPPDAAPEAIATIELRCELLGLHYTGDLLTDPFTARERENIRWYLEEYVDWPYEQFLERGKQIEASLPAFGRRMYAAVCASPGAMGIVQTWRLQPGVQHRQVSIVSEIPRALSLPWELLHDEQGFLVLRTRQPVSLIRRLPLRELAAFPVPFKPPLRILLVTARPDDEAFIDPRSIARELLDEMQQQVESGAIALEFLRPPTLPALRTRLSESSQPVQILHFDGHGILSKGTHGQGMLIFENEQGRADPVKAEDVAQVLLDSGVRLAVLTACQSALGNADDAFSSVAAQFIRSGVDAVIAMSASVLVVAATRYTEAFYHELAAGTPTPTAQERARQALHDNPQRDIHQHRPDDEGMVVTLRDWWLPHYYQQWPVALQPAKAARRRKKAPALTLLRLNEDLPAPPRYGFRGRSRELLNIERALLRKKLVVIHGFGGMGKTALAREAADWFTRTHLYDCACFISFEQGGDSSTVLSVLGSYLNVYDGDYNPGDVKTALAQLQPILQTTRVLVIADNLESVLPQGETPLDSGDRAQLWEVLLALKSMGAGVILTSRDTTLGDGRLAPGQHTHHFPLLGLRSDDAYILACHILDDLNIERSRAPYAEFRALLTELDYHPLAIQLVLPTLRDCSLTSIRADFAHLLPTFIDDATTGRNRSLLASLDYSLRRLSQEQQSLLASLAVFESGASEHILLAITQIPQETWITLRSTLEQAALLVVEQVHEAITVPFLHFHPVFLPFFRQKIEDQNNEVYQAQLLRYAEGYAIAAAQFERRSFQHPEIIYELVRRELPNLRAALELLLLMGRLKTASATATRLAGFLRDLGLVRERNRLLQRMEEMLLSASSMELTHATYLFEVSKAEEERRSGKAHTAFIRLENLLVRIQNLPKEAEDGPGSYSHCRALYELGYCQRTIGQLTAAIEQFYEALALMSELLAQNPKERTKRIFHASLHRELANILSEQGHYPQARAHYEQAFQECRAIGDALNEAATLAQIGNLALLQYDYYQAHEHYQQALQQFQIMKDIPRQVAIWHQLGMIAGELNDWQEAERNYRTSLALAEQISDIASAAKTCNQLALAAENLGRPVEAEGWYKSALKRLVEVEPDAISHVSCLSNLADLLVNEVRAGHVERTRLAEARQYLEQAQLIAEQPGISYENWNIYGLLADIAELEAQSALAQHYRQLEHKSFASFPGNRNRIDKLFASLIGDIAAAARGEIQTLNTVVMVLPTLEKGGWHVSKGIQRIWQGEREWQVLAEGLDRASALLLLRVLETLESDPDLSNS